MNIPSNLRSISAAALAACLLPSCSFCNKVALAVKENRPIFSPVPAVARVQPVDPEKVDPANPPAALPLAGISEKTLRQTGKRIVPRPVVAKSALYEWDGDDTAGRVSLVIDLSEQKARIYRGGRSVGWTYVATGKSGHRTPTGTYSIREKLQDKISNSWGRVVNRNGDVVVSDARNGKARVPRGGRFVGAPMPYWMRVNGGIGMHAGNIPNPGSPASHGCIRLPRYMAGKLFEVTSVGSTVKIVP